MPDGRTEVQLLSAQPLQLWHGWLPDHEVVLERLKARLPFTQHEVGTPAGRIPAPRLECFVADREGSAYTYAGERYEGAPMSEHHELAQLRHRVEQATGERWNAVFANLYRNGSDSIGWHADDETASLGPPEWVRIASLSLGAPRWFELKHRSSGERVRLQLRGGDLLLMGDGVQSEYLHSVPKCPDDRGVRLNLTFRRLVTG